MDKLNVCFFLSGQGTTLKSIVDSIKMGLLNINITGAVINKDISDCLEVTEFCNKNNINLLHCTRYNGESRVDYEKRLLTLINYNSNLFMFIGWNFVVTNYFIRNSPMIINLHPALPGTFIGNNAVAQALDAYKRGEITYTGSMIHHVIEEVDKGEVIKSIKVLINENDTLQRLTERIKYFEKGLVVSVLQNFVIEHINKQLTKDKSPYIGKVRKVTDIGYGYLLLSASDRLSSFDRHICNINGKGCVLNNMSKWWFANTAHIIDNHYVYSQGQHMIVRKTQTIKLEFVVRGYMTGSTNTSIWPMYKSGKRNMYGIKFRDGYSKNEKLDQIILTPTTKGVTDVPITGKEIVEQNYLTQEEYDFIAKKSIDLFTCGQRIASANGLILVDTKYEFGFLGDKIILIDELHTCDSSRYWNKSSYLNRLSDGKEPEKLDKDCIRDYIKSQCDPYKDILPIIPSDLISKVENVYNQYYNIFDNKNLDQNNYVNCLEETVTTNFFRNLIDKSVIIISGSVSDRNHCIKIQDKLKEKGIYSIIYHCSAHKDTKGVLDIINKYENQNRNLCYVTVAGMSNALSGVVSCNTRFPVIGCPPFSDKTDMLVNMNSTLQCPSNVPVMAIFSPGNVSLAISKIFNLF
jgi:phosphoribosylaminoimidazole-succinocarboxamide synthase